MIHSRFARPLRASMPALALAGVLFSFAPRLSAQTYEFAAVAGMARLKKNDLGSLQLTGALDDDTSIKTDRGFGGRITLNTPGYYGHEISYLLRSADVATKVLDENNERITKTGKTKIHQISYDFLMYMMPAKETWRPYIAVGMHAAQYQRPRIEDFDRGKARPLGFQYGGGIKFLIAKRGILRLDVRDYWGGAPWDLSFADRKGLESPRTSAGRLRTIEATVGVGFAF
jgi:hypothetical protein